MSFIAGIMKLCIKKSVYLRYLYTYAEEGHFRVKKTFAIGHMKSEIVHTLA
jgi:hypothetical protein